MCLELFILRKWKHQLMDEVWPSLLQCFRTLHIPGFEVALSQYDGQEGNGLLKLLSEGISTEVAKLYTWEIEWSLVQKYWVLFSRAFTLRIWLNTANTTFYQYENIRIIRAFLYLFKKWTVSLRQPFLLHPYDIISLSRRCQICKLCVHNWK